MPKKILLAEDSVTMQKVVQMTFAAEDYSVTAVSSVDEAIARASEVQPDVVIADTSMSGKTGYDLCQAIKNGGNVPVLLLHGSASPYDAGKGQSVGADAELSKPFETQALIDKVGELTAGGARAAAPARAPARAAAPPIESDIVIDTDALAKPKPAAPRPAAAKPAPKPAPPKPAAKPPAKPAAAAKPAPRAPAPPSKPAMPAAPKPSAPKPAPVAAKPAPASRPPVAKRPAPASKPRPAAAKPAMPSAPAPAPKPRPAPVPPTPAVAKAPPPPADDGSIEITIEAEPPPAHAQAGEPLPSFDSPPIAIEPRRDERPTATSTLLGMRAPDLPPPPPGMKLPSQLHQDSASFGAATAVARPSPSPADGDLAAEVARLTKRLAEVEGELARLKASGGAGGGDLDGASRETIERVVWEVVPDLAEVLIKEQLAKRGNK